MSVRVNNLGPTAIVPSGVPQGSALVPFLFSAFMGSVDFSRENVKCIKYVDDLTIIESLSRNQTSFIFLDECEALFKERGAVFKLVWLVIVNFFHL